MTDKTTLPVPSTSEILSREETVWKALCAGDAGADMAMLTEDFLGVYPSGFSDRAGHGAMLADGPTMQDYELSEVRLLPLADGVVLLSYRAAYLPVGKADWQAMYISSIWRFENGAWLNSFSQDSPADG